VVEVSPSQKPESSPTNFDVLWKINVTNRLELLAGNQLLEVWDSPLGWEWLKMDYLTRTPIASGCATSSDEAKNSALASLSEEQLRNLAAAAAAAATAAPRPRTRTYFNLIPCVVDLGIDTVGPGLMLEHQPSKEVGHILDAVSQYASCVGVETIEGGAGARHLEIRAWIRAIADRLMHAQPEFTPVDGQDLPSTEQPVRNLKKLQSEACSYVVLKSLGVEGDFSISSLRDCRITKRDLESNLHEIAQVSREILKGITPLKRVQEETLCVPVADPIADGLVPASWEEFQCALELQESPPLAAGVEEDLSPVKTTIRATI
jgi:hypothetical protein